VLRSAGLAAIFTGSIQPAARDAAAAGFAADEWIETAPAAAAEDEWLARTLAQIEALSEAAQQEELS